MSSIIQTYDVKSLMHLPLKARRRIIDRAVAMHWLDCAHYVAQQKWDRDCRQMSRPKNCNGN